MALAVVLLGTSIFVALACPDRSNLTFVDAHDGDRKVVEVRRDTLTITPANTGQSWKVSANLTPSTCAALIDFDVPGKPNPPAVKLSAALWYAAARQEESGLVVMKSVWEFTDPSGNLADKDYPLNQWLQLGPLQVSPFSPPCPAQLTYVYADMHTGGKKVVAIEGSSLTIRGLNGTWEIKAPFDSHRCAAEVNFTSASSSSYAGKLTVTLWKMLRKAHEKTSFHLTDPQGQLAPLGVPLSTWVEIKDPPPSRSSSGPSPAPSGNGCHCDCPCDCSSTA